MDYSKKTKPQPQRSYSEQRKPGNYRQTSSQKDQNETRSLSTEEIKRIRKKIENNSDRSEANLSTSQRRSKNQSAARRRQSVQNTRSHTSVNNVRTHSSISTNQSQNSRNAVNRSSDQQKRRAAQRKAAVKYASQQAKQNQFRGPAMAPPKKRRRPVSKGVKIAIVSCIVILLCGTAYCWHLITGNLNSDLSSASVREAYNISNEAAAMAKSQRIVNIAVFGIDGREDPEVIGDRSDAIMIASADFEHGAVKITSVMRDTFVWMEEEDDYDKINAAYSLGGAETAIKTINQNFDTAITDYVTINFECMITMVNAVGGVEVTIDDPDVLYWTNQYLGDVNLNCGTSSPIIEDLGTQTIDGSQALAYCRVRYAGNGDFDRTQRQREVFKQVILKALELNPLKQYALLQSVLPYVETSLSSDEITKYAANVMLMKGREFSQMQMPVSELCEVGYYGDVSYVFPNTLADNIKAWYQFVYEREYTPSNTAQNISDEISYLW